MKSSGDGQGDGTKANKRTTKIMTGGYFERINLP